MDDPRNIFVSGDSAPGMAKLDGSPDRADRLLVDPQRFLLATRDTGYRGTATAVAELVDNALQAGSQRIQILIGDDPSYAGGLRIGVLDDGRGMRPGQLTLALQFGGSERFGDRSGLGRYGMGLPNSSVSQARRVDVYSWVDAREVHRSCLDLDDVAAGQLSLHPVTRAALPTWVEQAPPHGTLVVWSRCDRLARRRAASLSAQLLGELGRLYRYQIWEGIDIDVNGVPVQARDPLFLHVRRGELRARPVGKELLYEVRIAGSEETSVIRVRFSELPVPEWQARSVEERRSAGVIGGGGVSIIRAGREIDYGWHLMGAKRRENYDDWWRCEIAFDPVLDELFGVTHSKQGIRPSPELAALLAPDLEDVARGLNRRVREAFIAVAEPKQSLAARKATRKEQLLPPTPAIGSAAEAPRGYRIESRDLQSGDFFQLETEHRDRRLVLNRHHPFFHRVYEPLLTHDNARFAIECLILSAARALDGYASVPGTGSADTVRADWSDALAAFLT